MTSTRSHLTAIVGLIASLHTAFSGPAIQKVEAEDLRNLMESHTMQEFHSKRNASATGMGAQGTKWTRGMDLNSNFAMIWETAEGGKVLLNWLDTKLSYYRTEHSRSSRNRDHVWAQTILMNEKKTQIIITVLVPHPTTEPLVTTNVFSPFRKYRPPTLEVLSEKTYDLKGAKGVLYEAKSDRCSMVVDVAEHSLVNIEVEHCKDSIALVDVAQRLNFERLNRKLSS